MNIRGFELLRKLGLSGPRKEVLVRDLTEVNLDDVYTGAIREVTIIAFDYSEPINQNPLFEKNVRQYKIPRDKFFEIGTILKLKLLEKGVDPTNIIFMVHQSYLPPDISYSGRAAVEID